MIDKKLSKEEIEKGLDSLAESSASRILIQYLELKVDELDSVYGADSVKEILGRQNAIKKLREVIQRLQPRQEINIKNEYK